MASRPWEFSHAPSSESPAKGSRDDAGCPACAASAVGPVESGQSWALVNCRARRQRTLAPITWRIPVIALFASRTASSAFHPSSWRSAATPCTGLLAGHMDRMSRSGQLRRAMAPVSSDDGWVVMVQVSWWSYSSVQQSSGGAPAGPPPSGSFPTPVDRATGRGSMLPPPVRAQVVGDRTAVRSNQRFRVAGGDHDVAGGRAHLVAQRPTAGLGRCQTMTLRTRQRPAGDGCPVSGCPP